MTLHQLRALLERAHGPAVERLTDRTPEGVARAYLPLDIRLQWSEHIADRMETADALREAENTYWSSRKSLCLADPGTVNAVKVALALALGLDPAAGVLWSRGRGGWWLHCEIDGPGTAHFGRNVASWPDWQGHRHLYAPIVAAEPDPVRALILAADHVLCSPAANEV